MAVDSLRLVVAINPHASFGKNPTAGPRVVSALRTAGHDVAMLQADSYEALRADVEAALGTSPDGLIVVGGDGMVHLGAEFCSRHNMPLGVIPAGTGNDLARHLGIPLDIEQAQEVLLDCLGQDPVSIDHGVSRGAEGADQPFACVLSAGFDAIVNERANRLSFPKGRHRYTLALLIELVKLRPLTYTLEIDGTTHTAKYLLVAVANAQSFGGGMKVTPQASVTDGYLDVFTLQPLSRLAFLRIYPRVFAGTHVTDSRVSITRAKSVRIESKGIVAYADGERVGSLPLEVTLNKGGLKVFAPALAPTGV